MDHENPYEGYEPAIKANPIRTCVEKVITRFVFWVFIFFLVFAILASLFFWLVDDLGVIKL